MPKYTKPYDPNVIWGSNALEGNISKPDDNKIRNGWLQEKPPFQEENWSMNKLHQGFAYYNQLGVPEWDSATEYQAGKSYVQGADGVIYKALVTNTGHNPAGSGRDRWEVAFIENRAVTSFGRQLIAQATAAHVRTVLGLGGAAVQSDDRYLHRSNNLTDLQNASAAFNNIKQQATTGRTGVVALATPEEVIEGVRDDVAVTPHTLGGMNPAGTVIQFAGPVAPTGYLECDGRALSRTEFSGLFSAIGTVYGSGNGTSTFNIPDMRGQFVRGWDSGRGIDSNRSLGSSQSDQIQSHNHSGNTASAGNHSHTGEANSAGAHSHTGSVSSAGAHSHTGTTSTAGSHSHSGSTLSAGAHSHSGSIASAGAHSHSGSTNSAGAHSHPYADSYYIENSSVIGGADGYFNVSNRTGSARTDSDNNRIFYMNRTTATSGAHTHSLSVNSGGAHSHTMTVNSGGDHTHALSVTSAGNHTHTLSVDSAGNHTHSLTVNGAGNHTHSLSVNSAGSHGHSFTTNSTGGGETRPVNVALMFCIKT